eukprot:TRINITY_DN7673_c0_g1_i4.p3 TRINITY_DN7673_c0_g1~~TRINITY_DN7673_c0_g1_i4.p3  ORF type:complete len:298 (-),score=82.25 TRINITY_DN7673_c0_g1_i4:1337-2230(-)
MITRTTMTMMPSPSIPAPRREIERDVAAGLAVVVLVVALEDDDMVVLVVTGLLVTTDVMVVLVTTDVTVVEGWSGLKVEEDSEAVVEVVSGLVVDADDGDVMTGPLVLEDDIPVEDVDVLGVVVEGCGVVDGFDGVVDAGAGVRVVGVVDDDPADLEQEDVDSADDVELGMTDVDDVMAELVVLVWLGVAVGEMEVDSDDIALVEEVVMEVDEEGWDEVDGVAGVDDDDVDVVLASADVLAAGVVLLVKLVLFVLNGLVLPDVVVGVVDIDCVVGCLHASIKVMQRQAGQEAVPLLR